MATAKAFIKLGCKAGSMRKLELKKVSRHCFTYIPIMRIEKDLC